MFCSKCGQPIQQQAFCSSCGAPTGLNLQAAAAAPAYAIPANLSHLSSRIQRHLQTVGILWIAFAGYSTLHWLLAYTFLRGFFHSHVWFMGTPGFMGGMPFANTWWMSVITVIVVARAILSLAVGIAILTRQPWARTFALVVAILTLIKPITGTALAIYTLWAFWGPNARFDYSQIISEP